MTNQSTGPSRKSTNWIGSFIALGAGIGAAMGVAFENIAMGVAIGVASGVVIGASMNAFRNSPNSPEESTPGESKTHRSARSLMARFIWAMIGFVLAMVVTIMVVGQTDSLALKVLFALVPVVPAFFGFLVIVEVYARQDELERLILLEALTFSLGGTAVVSLIVGLLENAGLQQPNWVWLIPLISVLNVVGQWVARRRYR